MEGVVNDIVTVKVRFERVVFEKPGDLKPKGFVFVVTEPGKYFGKQIKYANDWESLDYRKLVSGREYWMRTFRDNIDVDGFLCDNGLRLKQ